MKIFTDLLLTTLLISSATIIGYTNYYQNLAKTSNQAPNSIISNGNRLTSYEELKNSLDATSSVRQAQANADIRVREQRHLFFSREKSKSDRNLASQVRSQLELNLPTASLAVKSNQGVVTVAGIVGKKAQLDEIVTLAHEIEGVIDVKVNADFTSF